MRNLVLGALIAGLWTCSASAHEFWIAPTDYTVAPGDAITASLRVGEDFEGAEIPYLEFRSFVLLTPEGVTHVEGTLGDRPAAQVVAGGPGAAILAYESGGSSITFDTFEPFAAYVAYENQPEIAERHRALGMPETDIREQYIRNAKALISVDGAPARDRALGLTFEAVALDTPAEAAAKGAMRVRLLWRGRPVPDHGFNLFRKGAPDNPTPLRTGADGEAVLPLSGPGTYMVNAVHLTPVNTPALHWQSFWASLTFGIE